MNFVEFLKRISNIFDLQGNLVCSLFNRKKIFYLTRGVALEEETGLGGISARINERKVSHKRLQGS